MIAKDEERLLAKCLDSVRGLASEFIVVDTGSRDETPRIAAEYGAKVVAFDFSVVDFAGARNCAISHAAGPWILMLDADETLDPAGIAAVEQLIRQDANAAYYLERHNHNSASDQPFQDHVMRLFPARLNPRYRGRVHETVDESIRAAGGKLIPTPIRIQHNFSADSETRRRKNHWYIQILQEEIAADPADDSRLDFLAAEYHQLELFDEATAVAERIAQVRPRDPQAHLFAGVYHLLYKPDLPRARADLMEALRLRPDYPEARSFLELLEQRDRGQGL